MNYPFGVSGEDIDKHINDPQVDDYTITLPCPGCGDSIDILVHSEYGTSEYNGGDAIPCHECETMLICTGTALEVTG